MSTLLDSWDEDEGRAMTLHGRPEQRTGKQFRFRLEAGQWWELVLNIKPIMAAFNPIPCTCWTARGHGGRDQVTCHGVTFSFRETQRPGWRSSVEDGQIPYFYFWKL